jgi:hypothetical protein
MKIRATATFRPGNYAAVEAKLLPRLIEGATVGANIVLDISQEMVPVDTGELKGSGRVSVEKQGTVITGYIVYGGDGIDYALYVEAGTGRRGATSAGSGPWEYNLAWPGMVAEPYIRPALDIGRQDVLDAFRAALGL